MLIENELRAQHQLAERLEPKKTLDKQESFQVSAPRLQTLLALLKDFRTLDWAEEYKYPTVILSQMKQLLAEQQEG